MSRALVAVRHRCARPVALAIPFLVCCGIAIPEASGQSMPGQAYYDLIEQGQLQLARDLTRRLDLRSRPDRDDVEDLLERWEDDAGGPRTGSDWLAVARLWVRAGEEDRARSALRRTEDRIPEAVYLFERARITFLDADIAGAADYWRACELANEAAIAEAWLDIEVLATPDELERWDQFRRLPAAERDNCGFLRRFWHLRAAYSGMPLDERILEHYQRIQYALEHYRRRGRVRPRFSARLGRPTNSAFDDRGLLHIRMGTPDEVAMHGGSQCIEPNVSWGYNRPEGFRVYHLSSLGDVDDWYLLENLSMVYRCGAWDQNPMVAISPLLIDIPPQAMHDLYMSRMGLDPAYARIANQALNRIGDAFVGLRVAEQLSDERHWTWEDGEYAVSTVPERPAVDLSVNFGLEWLAFRAPLPGLTRVWMNGLVEASTLEAEEVDGQDVYRVRINWTLRDATGDFYRHVPATFELAAPPDLGPDAGLAIRMQTDVPPGDYEWLLAIEDLTPEDSENRSRPGGYAVGSMTVRDMSADLPVLSDVAVSPDSAGAWIPAAGITLNPTPTHVTGPDGVAYIYYEAYNLTPGGRYETRVVLEPEDGEQVFDVSYPGDAPAVGRVVTHGYLKVDLSATRPGPYRMTVTVRDLTSGVTTLPVHTDIVVDRD